MKLPVFKAFGASLAYVGANLLTLFKILWLPDADPDGRAVLFHAFHDGSANADRGAWKKDAEPAEVFALMGSHISSRWD